MKGPVRINLRVHNCFYSKDTRFDNFVEKRCFEINRQDCVIQTCRSLENWYFLHVFLLKVQRHGRKWRVQQRKRDQLRKWTFDTYQEAQRKRDIVFR